MSTIAEYAVKLTANITDFSRGMDEVEKRLSMTEKESARFSNLMEKALSSADPATRRLGASMDSLSQKYQKQVDQYKTFVDQMSNCGAKLAQLKDSYEAQKYVIEENQAKLKGLRESLKELTTYQEKAKEQMSRGIMPNAKEWVASENGIARARKQIATLTQELPEQRQELKELKAQVESYSEALAKSQHNVELSANSASNMKTQMMGMANQAEGVTKAGTSIASVGATVGAVAGKVNVVIGVITTAVSVIISGVKKIAGAVTSTTKKIVSAVASTVKKAVSLTVSGVKTIASGISSFFSKMNEARRQSDLLDVSVKKITKTFNSFGNLLIRRFKRQLISGVFNGLKEGVNNLALESDRLNYALSSMIGAFKTFSNAIASAFAPLIQVASPIVTAFVNHLTDAMNTIASFTARLTGRDTYEKAIPVSYDYAASLDKTANAQNKNAKATDKATKAAQKYKNTIMSFDELHVLNGEDTSSDSSSVDVSGAADSVANADKKFQTVAIGKKVKGIADDLADAFRKHDWDRLGKLMAQGVNNAFKWLDNIVKWQNCGKKITAICNGITKTINSFVKNLDTKLIGKTFGDLINTIVNTVMLLQTGIDWIAIGKALGTGVKSMIDTVNWKNLGSVIVGHFQSILYIVQGFVSTPGIFKSIGKALRDGIAGAVERLDDTAWGDTAGKLFNGIFQAVSIAFSDMTTFETLGQKLASNLNTAIDKIEPQYFANAVGNTVNAILTTFIEFVTNTHWDELGTKVGDSIVGAIKKIPYMKFGEAAGYVFNSFFDFLKNAFSDIEGWAQLGTKIGTNLNAAIYTIEPKTFADGVSNFVLAILNSIKNFIAVVDWQALGDTISECIRLIKWEEIGDAVFGLVATAIDNVPDKGLGEKAAGLFNRFFDFLAMEFGEGGNGKKFEDLATKLATNLNAAIEGIDEEKFGNGVTAFITTLQNAVNNFLETFDWAGTGKKIADSLAEVDWDEVKKGFETGFDLALKGIGTFILELIKESLKKKFESQAKLVAEGHGEKVATGIINGIKKFSVLWNPSAIIKTPIENGIKRVMEIHSPSKVTERLGGHIGQGLADGIKDKESTITGFFSDLPGKIESKLSGAWSTLRSVGKDLGEAISDGLSGVDIKMPHFSVDWDTFGIGDFSIPVPSVSVDWYANGGFPEDGFFFANHNELVGRFANGRTAVANNDQIESGIESAVANAVIPILLDINKSIQENGKNSDREITMDGERVARLITKHQKRINAREYGFAR